MDKTMRWLALGAIVLWLSACTHLPRTLVAVDDAPVDNLADVAQLVEDDDDPLLLRGFDGAALPSLRVPSLLNRYAYVVRAGHHALWVVGTAYPHPLIPQRLHCYVIEAKFAAGARYRLWEDVATRSALLLNDDTGTPVATGRLVDEPWVFLRGCHWQ